MTKPWCVGGRHYSNTKYIGVYEKFNHKTIKPGKNIKSTCSICGRNKSQIFTSISDTGRKFYEKGKM